MATFVGFYIGYIIETKYVNFKNHKNFRNNLFRLLIGMALLGLVQFGFKYIFPDYRIFTIARYFLVGITATFIVPCIFKRFKI